MASASRRLPGAMTAIPAPMSAGDQIPGETGMGFAESADQ